MALHYNLNKVYAISNDDEEFVNHVIQLFVQEVPLELQQIKVAIEALDFEQAYASSHKIKPTLDLLGLDLAYKLNLEIETWTKNQGNKKQIKEVYKSFKELMDCALKEVRKDYNL